MSEKTGLVVFWKNYDRKAIIEYAKRAEDLGYHSLWIPEVWGYDAFSLLTEIAVHTNRIQLGTGIVNIFSRSPATLAMHAATLDEISEGRFILGMGTSGAKVIEGFHGVPFKKPLTRFRQTIRCIQTLLAGGKLSDAGADLWEFRHFQLAMTPVRDRVPIYCACLNDKAIRMVGELADGWMPTFWPHDQIYKGRALLDEGAARSGRDGSEVEIAPFTTVIPMPDPEMSYANARKVLSFYIGGMGEYYHALLCRMGYQEAADNVRSLYESGKRAEAAEAVTQDLLNALVIAGDPGFCRSRLSEWRDHGVQLPLLYLPTDLGPDMCNMYLDIMAPA